MKAAIYCRVSTDAQISVATLPLDEHRDFRPMMRIDIQFHFHFL